jgi:hypothetical protein
VTTNATWTIEEFAAATDTAPGSIQRQAVGEMETYYWPDTIGGEAGWWWGVACEGRLFAVGRTSAASDRDSDIGRA